MSTGQASKKIQLHGKSEPAHQKILLKSPSFPLGPHLPFQNERGTYLCSMFSWACQCLPTSISVALLAASLGGVSVCLPPSAAMLEVTFCTGGDKMRESRQGLPALCKAVNEKSPRKSQELLGSNLWVSPLPPSGWRQGGWRRYVTSPKPHGNSVTQIQPMRTPCPVLSLHHNTVPTFPLFTTRISPLSSFENLHCVSTMLREKKKKKNLIKKPIKYALHFSRTLSICVH